MKALGKEWDSEDFRQLATLLPVFHFQSFLAFLETRYTSGSEPCGLVEATSEVYDLYVGDVIKKVSMGLFKGILSSIFVFPTISSVLIYAVGDIYERNIIFLGASIRKERRFETGSTRELCEQPVNDKGRGQSREKHQAT